MKDIGAKISILIILLGLLFMASVLFDVSGASDLRESVIPESHRTYQDVQRDNELNTGLFEFESYVASVRGEGVAAPVDYSTEPLAQSVAEIIDPTYAAIGVNFAGQYHITTWSCGVDCQSNAIINTETGAIVDFGLLSSSGIAFSKTSGLLIVNPDMELDRVASSSTSTLSTDYYVMENDELTYIGKFINGENILNECVQATTTARNFLTNEIAAFDSLCQVPSGWEVVQ